MRDKPQNIFNVCESGVSTEHSPPKSVCITNTEPQNITSTRSFNVTIIAAGNALGNDVSPYYIVPVQRWNPDLLNGACPGAADEMSKKGCSNSHYIAKHFFNICKIVWWQSQWLHFYFIRWTQVTHLTNLIWLGKRTQSDHIWFASSFQPLDPASVRCSVWPV